MAPRSKPPSSPASIIAVTSQLASRLPPLLPIIHFPWEPETLSAEALFLLWAGSSHGSQLTWNASQSLQPTSSPRCGPRTPCRISCSLGFSAPASVHICEHTENSDPPAALAPWCPQGSFPHFRQVSAPSKVTVWMRPSSTPPRPLWAPHLASQSYLLFSFLPLCVFAQFMCFSPSTET